MAQRKTKKKGGRRGAANAAATESPKAIPVVPVVPLPIDPRGRLALALWLLGIGAVVVVYAGLKAFSLNAYPGDEFIYLYQSKLISEGVTPYSEFAMAHPPVQMLFAALLFKLFGFDFLLVRLLPALWCLAGGLGLALLVRREIGALASFVACGLYLLAHEPLRASSHFTGVNMTVALIIFAVLAYRKGAIRTTAVLSVLAVFTRLYAAPAVAVLAAFALLADRRPGLRLVAWGAAVGLLAFLAIGLWTGFGSMLHNMALYHAQKTPMSASSLAGMRDKVLFHNATLAALFAISLPAVVAAVARAFAAKVEKQGFFRRLAAASTEGALGLVVLAACLALAYLFMLSKMNRVWMYYYIPAFPFAAVAAGWLVGRLGNGLARLLAARFRLAASGLTPSRLFAGLAAVVLFGASFALSPRLESNLAYYEDEMQKSADERGHLYAFPPSPLPTAANDFVRDHFWHEERVIGERHTAFDYVMWHESRVLDLTDDAIAIIRRETTPGGEIFGDSGTVPLFALLSGRRIAGNEVDTNIQRYRSGNADPKELVARIDDPRTELMILRSGYFGVAGVPEIRRLVEEKYALAETLKTKENWALRFYKRKGD